MKATAEMLKVGSILPPAFVCFIIGIIWSAYVGMHLTWLLQVHLPMDFRNLQAFSKGRQQLVISQALILMLLICYTRAFLTNPGGVPDTDEWRLQPDEDVIPHTREVKLTGKRRHCKWCLQYKPDRCHHCRVCKTCVLRMDHHCPWIMNCVGFRNHKYFFLLIFYTVLNCFYCGSTLWESVSESTTRDIPMGNRFYMVLGLVLTVIMGTLMTVFFLFHTWLMFHGMSTIEYCEKRSQLFPEGKPTYDKGYYKNVCAVLGPQPLLWFLPVSLPTGDGVHWQVVEGWEVEPEWTGEPAQRSEPAPASTKDAA